MKKIVVVFVLCGFAVLNAAAQSPRHPGVVLFEQAKFSEAIRSLESATKSNQHASDAEVWNYLGLAYLANKELKKSRKAFEKSVDLNPRNPVYHSNLAFAYLMNGQIGKARSTATRAIELDPGNAQAYQVRATAFGRANNLDAAERDADKFIQLSPGSAQAYLLKSEVLLVKLGVKVSTGKSIKDEIGYLQRALDTLKVGVEKTKGHPSHSEVVSEYEAVGVFHRHFSRDPVITSGDTPPTPEPGTTPLRITSKPRPSYTDNARTNGISGTVRIVALLGASGKVENLLVVKRLGYGLDQEAVKAARQIKFEPKKVNGKPVSSVVTFEYGFTIY